MNQALSDLELQLAAMRHDFDAAFAAPAAVTAHQTIDFVALRLGDLPCAIRTSEIAGLHSDIAITPVPSPIPSLRGIAGLRSEILPVHDLALLIGLPPTSAGRWIVLDATGTIALAFSGFNDHFRVEMSAVLATDESSRWQHVRQAVRQGDLLRPIIDIPSVLSAVRDQVSRLTKLKE